MKSEFDQKMFCIRTLNRVISKADRLDPDDVTGLQSVRAEIILEAFADLRSHMPVSASEAEGLIHLFSANLKRHLEGDVFDDQDDDQDDDDQDDERYDF